MRRRPDVGRVRGRTRRPGGTIQQRPAPGSHNVIYRIKARDEPVPHDLIVEGAGVAPVGESLAGWLASQALQGHDWLVLRDEVLRGGPGWGFVRELAVARYEPEGGR